MKFIVHLIGIALMMFAIVSADVPRPPVPPDPDPPVPPTPIVVEGRRTVVILHETETDTDEFARLVVALRAGAHADYISSKGHTLTILDDDAKDENGQPVPLVSTLLPLNPQLPALFVLDSGDGRRLHHQALPADATAADVMAVLREHGG